MRRLVCVALTAVLAASAGGCSLLDTDPPEDTVQEFLQAFAAGKTREAAALTDAPKSAKAALDKARGALEPTKVVPNVGDGTDGGSDASVPYTLNWRLGKGREWSYEADADLVKGDEGWQVRWSPSVLHPKLAAQQSLAVQVDRPALAPVLDREGKQLLKPDSVVAISLYPDEASRDGGVGKVAGSLAASLRQFDSEITKKSITAGADKVKDKNGSSLVAVLRDADYRKVKSEIYELPGVKFSRQERLLAQDKTYGAQVLPAIRSHVEDKIAGQAGWRVVARDSTGAEAAVLHAEDAQPSKAVDTTLDRKTLTAAEKAVDAETKPAVIVAMSASSGELRAVAQNEKADAEGGIALSGRYPPGSTFKIATALAGMNAGELTPDTRVSCPGTTVIGGRLIPNDDRFSLGKVPLERAFARSCNTTFAQLAAKMPAKALTDAAGDLGIGSDFEIGGLTTITGSAPAADNKVQRAENGIGQGTILASPFGMALAAATVKSGKTPVPSLIDGEKTKAKDLGDPLPQDKAEDLRKMMRKVVTEGTATKLASVSGVHGKTGTAQYGDGTRSHGWFVGYSGDLAFAVLVVGGDSSKPAVDVAHRFLSSR